MPGYNSQNQDTAHTLPNQVVNCVVLFLIMLFCYCVVLLLIVLLLLLIVLYCVLFMCKYYCTTATG